MLSISRVLGTASGGNVDSHWAYRTGIGREEKEVRQSRGMGHGGRPPWDPRSRRKETEWSGLSLILG